MGAPPNSDAWSGPKTHQSSRSTRTTSFRDHTPNSKQAWPHQIQAAVRASSYRPIVRNSRAATNLTTLSGTRLISSLPRNTAGTFGEHHAKRCSCCDPEHALETGNQSDRPARCGCQCCFRSERLQARAHWPLPRPRMNGSPLWWRNSERMRTSCPPPPFARPRRSARASGLKALARGERARRERRPDRAEWSRSSRSSRFVGLVRKFGRERCCRASRDNCCNRNWRRRRVAEAVLREQRGYRSPRPCSVPLRRRARCRNGPASRDCSLKLYSGQPQPQPSRGRGGGGCRSIGGESTTLRKFSLLASSCACAVSSLPSASASRAWDCATSVRVRSRTSNRSLVACRLTRRIRTLFASSSAMA